MCYLRQLPTECWVTSEKTKKPLGLSFIRSGAGMQDSRALTENN